RRSRLPRQSKNRVRKTEATAITCPSSRKCEVKVSTKMTNCRRLVVALLLLTLAKVHAQTCISDAQLSLTKIGSMPVSQDGLIHVKYAFSGNVSQAAQGVVANAAQQWNAQTGTNGVVFEQASPGQTPDIVIRSDPPNSGGCTAMNVATGN